MDLLSRQSADPSHERLVKIDILEQNLMLYARQLLFLLILKEDALTTEEKAKFILEVTGNIMVNLLVNMKYYLIAMSRLSAYLIVKTSIT